MDMYLILAIGLVTVSLVWLVIGRKKAIDILTPEQLALIDSACTKALEYAEQVCKEDPTVDRGQLALEYAFDIIKEAGIGIIPDAYFEIVQGMLMSVIGSKIAE